LLNFYKHKNIYCGDSIGEAVRSTLEYAQNISFGKTLCSVLFFGFLIKEAIFEKNIPTVAQIIKL